MHYLLFIILLITQGKCWNWNYIESYIFKGAVNVQYTSVVGNVSLRSRLQLQSIIVSNAVFFPFWFILHTEKIITNEKRNQKLMTPDKSWTLQDVVIDRDHQHFHAHNIFHTNSFLRASTRKYHATELLLEFVWFCFFNRLLWSILQRKWTKRLQNGARYAINAAYLDGALFPSPLSCAVLNQIPSARQKWSSLTQT